MNGTHLTLGLTAALVVADALSQRGSRNPSSPRRRAELFAGSYEPEAKPVDPNAPLTDSELRKLGIANVWVMDVECDGGKPPSRISTLSWGTDRRLTPAEGREVIAWAESTAPGWYWD